MKIEMHQLYDSPMVRFLARFARRCTVVLTSGMELSFEKGKRCGSCGYEGVMTLFDEQEYIITQRIMEI